MAEALSPARIEQELKDQLASKASSALSNPSVSSSCLSAPEQLERQRKRRQVSAAAISQGKQQQQHQSSKQILLHEQQKRGEKNVPSPSSALRRISLIPQHLRSSISTPPPSPSSPSFGRGFQSQLLPSLSLMDDESSIPKQVFHAFGGHTYEGPSCIPPQSLLRPSVVADAVFSGPNNTKFDLHFTPVVSSPSANSFSDLPPSQDSFDTFELFEKAFIQWAQHQSSCPLLPPTPIGSQLNSPATSPSSNPDWKSSTFPREPLPASYPTFQEYESALLKWAFAVSTMVTPLPPHASQVIELIGSVSHTHTTGHHHSKPSHQQHRPASLPTAPPSVSSHAVAISSKTRLLLQSIFQHWLDSKLLRRELTGSFNWSPVLKLHGVLAKEADACSLTNTLPAAVKIPPPSSQDLVSAFREEISLEFVTSPNPSSPASPAPLLASQCSQLLLRGLPHQTPVLFSSIEYDFDPSISPDIQFLPAETELGTISLPSLSSSPEYRHYCRRVLNAIRSSNCMDTLYTWYYGANAASLHENGVTILSQLFTSDHSESDFLTLLVCNSSVYLDTFTSFLASSSSILEMIALQLSADGLRSLLSLMETEAEAERQQQQQQPKRLTDAKISRLVIELIRDPISFDIISPLLDSLFSSASSASLDLLSRFSLCCSFFTPLLNPVFIPSSDALAYWTRASSPATVSLLHHSLSLYYLSLASAAVVVPSSPAPFSSTLERHMSSITSLLTGADSSIIIPQLWHLFNHRSVCVSETSHFLLRFLLLRLSSFSSIVGDALKPSLMQDLCSCARSSRFSHVQYRIPKLWQEISSSKLYSHLFVDRYSSIANILQDISEVNVIVPSASAAAAAQALPPLPQVQWPSLTSSATSRLLLPMNNSQPSASIASKVGKFFSSASGSSSSAGASTSTAAAAAASKPVTLLSHLALSTVQSFLSPSPSSSAALSDLTVTYITKLHEQRLYNTLLDQIQTAVRQKRTHDPRIVAMIDLLSHLIQKMIASKLIIGQGAAVADAKKTSAARASVEQQHQSQSQQQQAIIVQSSDLIQAVEYIASEASSSSSAGSNSSASSGPSKSNKTESSNSGAASDSNLPRIAMLKLLYRMLQVPGAFDMVRRSSNFFSSLLQSCRDNSDIQFNRMAWKLFYSLVKYNSGVIELLIQANNQLSSFFEVMSSNSLCAFAKILSLSATNRSKFSRVSEDVRRNWSASHRSFAQFLFSKQKLILCHLCYKKSAPASFFTAPAVVSSPLLPSSPSQSAIASSSSSLGGSGGHLFQSLVRFYVAMKRNTEFSMLLDDAKNKNQEVWSGFSHIFAAAQWEDKPKASLSQ